MKSKSLLMFFAPVSLILGCDSGCQASTVNVGRANVPIVLVDQNTGQNTRVVTSDADGNVSVPCGERIGINQ